MHVLCARVKTQMTCTYITVYYIALFYIAWHDITSHWITFHTCILDRQIDRCIICHAALPVKQSAINQARYLNDPMYNSYLYDSASSWVHHLATGLLNHWFPFVSMAISEDRNQAIVHWLPEERTSQVQPPKLPDRREIDQKLWIATLQPLQSGCGVFYPFPDLLLVFGWTLCCYLVASLDTRHFDLLPSAHHWQRWTSRQGAIGWTSRLFIPDKLRNEYPWVLPKC